MKTVHYSMNVEKFRDGDRLWLPELKLILRIWVSAEVLYISLSLPSLCVIICVQGTSVCHWQRVCLSFGDLWGWVRLGN